MKKERTSKKEYSFGSCRVEEFKPKRETWNSKTNIINTIITFDEALRLKLALDAVLMEINKYKRNSIEGKNTGIDLVINLSGSIMSVVEATPKKKKAKK